MLGFVYEESGVINVTHFGQTMLRWLSILSEKNAPTLGLYAARSLAAYQLRNPTAWGQKYDECVEVFPFSFIWRAMLALDDRISSEELNREIFRVTDEHSLHAAVHNIRAARKAGDPSLLGLPAITGSRVNDRIIPWVSMASFGYTLIADKGGTDYYTLRPEARSTLVRAAAVRHEHRTFRSTGEYVRHLSRLAGMPHVHPENVDLPEISDPTLAIEGAP
jgi:hypothetical protein